MGGHPAGGLGPPRRTAGALIPVTDEEVLFLSSLHRKQLIHVC